jgi:hypothetical protein
MNDVDIVKVMNGELVIDSLPDEFEVRVDDTDVMRVAGKELKKNMKQLYKFVRLCQSLGYIVDWYRPLWLKASTVWKFVRKDILIGR